MRVFRNSLLTVATLAAFVPLGAQTVDTAQARFQQPQAVQYLRFQDKRGINVFETPKVAGIEYDGFRMAWGAAFTQQFQGLDHENSADSVEVAAVAPSPGSAGSAAISDRNRLIEIGNGFNNATANMYLHAQLAPGIRLQMTSYLSARHHNETWVKDGFLQVDASPIDVPLFHKLMEYTTLKIGHFEVNYGDFHFRRSDNGQAIYNPFVGNAIMDAFTTEVGTEAIVQKNGLLAVLALTNGEIRGNTQRPADRSPAVMAKLGFDRQLTEALRVRLTGSYRVQESAISNTLYSGDRAGSRYYNVLENFRASESSQFTSGRINPGFSDKITAMMINPFVKFRGIEFFGMYETAEGRASPDTNPEREVKQYMAEALYRFGHGEKFYLGGRWNAVEGDLGGTNTAITVTRSNFGGGWFVTPSLLMKAEIVNQVYRGFATTDIRHGGKFGGFMIEAVTAF
jgi:hypothetical protein